MVYLPTFTIQIHYTIHGSYGLSYQNGLGPNPLCQADW